MKRSIPLAIFLAVLAASNSTFAGEPSDAAARARLIAPYVNDMTVAVAHVDISRVAIGPLAETLARLAPDAKRNIGHLQAEAARRIGQLIQAGVKDVYLTVSLGGPGPYPTILAILPLPVAADEKSVRAALDIPPAAGRRVGDALVIRLPLTDKRPLEIRSSPRPELTAAFEAAGSGTVQAVLIPPAYSRRVIEELMPQLPQQIGGGPSSILTQGVSWAALGIDLSPPLSLHAVIKSQDAQAAAALHKKWTDILRLASQQVEVRKIVPQFDLLVVLLTPKLESDRLQLSLDAKTAGIDALVCGSAGVARKRAHHGLQAQSMNNAKQIVLAMHDYNSSHRHFPAASSFGPDGKPLLSWRVYLLPFIDQQRLFEQFHLNEPWDSPHNKTLIERMPTVYQSLGTKAEKGKTCYLVPVGNGAIYSSGRDEPKVEDVKDGLSNTIMLVEVDDQHAVVWTRPDDLAFDPKDPKTGIGSPQQDGFITAFCDGSVRFLSAGVDAKTLSALFTRAGGEVIGPY